LEKNSETTVLTGNVRRISVEHRSIRWSGNRLAEIVPTVQFDHFTGGPVSPRHKILEGRPEKDIRAKPYEAVQRENRSA